MNINLLLATYGVIAQTAAENQRFFKILSGKFNDKRGFQGPNERLATPWNKNHFDYEEHTVLLETVNYGT